MRKNAKPDFKEFEETKPSWIILDWLDGPRNFMRKMYNWVISWSEKKSAERALAILSFAESSFFPIPPDPLLIAMVTAKPKKWLRLAVITTGASVIGGMLGYFIGNFLIEAIMPVIINLGYEEAYKTAVNWFQNWGGWAVLIAGFTPVPYKIFTIAGGAAHMALLPFFVGSIIGRAGRFFLVAYLMHYFGERYKDKIEKYIDILGFAFIALIIVGFIVIKFIN